MNRSVAAVAACVSVAGYLVSLFLGWAVVDGTSQGFFQVIGESSAVTALLSVLFLLFTLVALGLSGTALFTPPRKHRWYAVGAVLTAVADLGCAAGLWYRIGRSDSIAPGAGVYVAAVAVLAVVVVAMVSTGGYPYGDGPQDR